MAETLTQQPAVADAPGAPSVRLQSRHAAPGVGPTGQTPLTRSVLDALDRPPLPKLVPTTFRTIVSGLLTAGLWPAVMLPYHWVQVLRWHRSVIRHLAEWASVDLGEIEGRRLHELNSIRLSRAVSVAAGLCGVAAGVVTGAGVLGGIAVSQFWYSDPLQAGSDNLWIAAFLGFLGLAYLLQWMSVNLHARRLRKVEGALEEMTLDLGPMKSAKRGAGGWAWGIRPVATTLSGLLALVGMIWTLPMLAASTAQRQVVLKHHRRSRQRLAGRVRQVLANRRPIQSLPAVVDRSARCRNPRCDALIAPDAKHCPRCGMLQSPVSRYLD